MGTSLGTLPSQMMQGFSYNPSSLVEFEVVQEKHTLAASQPASHSSLQAQCMGFPSSGTEVREATLENTVLFRPEETREKVP